MTPNGAKLSSQMTARERAIAKLTAPPVEQTQETPVLNATSVQPEEMGAIVPSSAKEEEQGQITPVEEQQAAEQVKEEKNPLSSQFAQLARKEKALRAQAQELKALEMAVKAKEEAFKMLEQRQAQPAQSQEPLKDRLKKDPQGTLSELGLSYDELTDLMMNQPSQAERAQLQKIQELETKIEQLSKGQENVIKAQEERQTEAYNQAVKQLRREAEQLAKGDETFETIRETGSYDDVVELITRTFEEDGVLMSVEEAAQAVEDYLVEEAEKLMRIKKISAKFNKPAQQDNTGKPKAEPQSQTPKTLTNAVASTRKLSAKERAILAFKGELKS